MTEKITVGIVGNGTKSLIADLTHYSKEVDVWIGADRGALTLLEHNLEVDLAIGDFDSVNEEEFKQIKEQVDQVEIHPEEKNATDLELAIEKAYELQVEKIYLFAVTGTRKDHELLNIQHLYSIAKRGIQGIIIDQFNYLEITLPGKHKLIQDDMYSKISFVPFSEFVKGLTLTGFYYPLQDETVQWGQSLTISNQLSEKSGTYSFKQGIVLLIKSREDL